VDVQVHTDPGAFSELAAGWNELLLRSENTSLFSRHEYLSKWWKHFGAGRKPFVAEFRDNGETVGYAPLMDRIAESGDRLELCAMGYFADYCGFVVQPEYEERVASTFFSLIEDRGVDALTLDHFREETRVFRALVDVLQQRDHLYRPLAVTRSPFVAIEGPWEDFIRGRSRNAYRDLRKKLNRLDGTPALEVEVIAGQAEYRDHVQRMLEMHIKLWRSRGQPTPYTTPERRLFLRELGQAMLKEGILRFTCLKLEGRPVAYLWCYDHKGVRHYLNAAWDLSHASLSPGSLLLINDMRDAFDRGLAEYDMLGGEEPYKYRYATGRRHITTLMFGYLGRSRRRIRPLRPAAASTVDVSSAVTGDTRRHNLLITAHSDDEAIFFGELLRRDPEMKWTCCLVTLPSNSPLIREHRLAEFKRSCRLLGLEPVFLEFEESSEEQPLDVEELASRLAAHFPQGCRFHGIYSHGAFGEYGSSHHAAVSLAAHQAFDGVWSLAGPLAAEVILRESPAVDFPGKLEYFRDVHHSQVFLADLVSPEERYVRLPRERVQLIHRIFFGRAARSHWEPALTDDELGRTKELFAPLFDAYFSRSRCPAELAGAAGSNKIDVITPIQLRILDAALGVVAAGGGEAVAGFVRQLVRSPEMVTPGAVGAAGELTSLLENVTG